MAFSALPSSRETPSGRIGANTRYRSAVYAECAGLMTSACLLLDLCKIDSGLLERKYSWTPRNQPLVPDIFE
jgi:hypothetical protein